MCAEGTVIWFAEEKGYGYLEPDDGSAPVRVERAVAETGDFRTLLEGQRVRYELGEPQGDEPVAAWVRVI
ncbi:MAG TPA: cold-shock protein [Armatimonadetes bacterium]|nr:cold-shock protein [Armatimonadota bacterium]